MNSAVLWMSSAIFWMSSAIFWMSLVSFAEVDVSEKDRDILNVVCAFSFDTVDSYDRQ